MEKWKRINENIQTQRRQSYTARLFSVKALYIHQLTIVGILTKQTRILSIRTDLIHKNNILQKITFTTWLRDELI